MSDNTKNTDNRDRSQVAGAQEWELNYVAHKFNTTAEVVEQAIKDVGNKREDVEAYLTKQQKN